MFTESADILWFVLMIVTSIIYLSSRPTRRIRPNGGGFTQPKRSIIHYLAASLAVLSLSVLVILNGYDAIWRDAPSDRARFLILLIPQLVLLWLLINGWSDRKYHWLLSRLPLIVLHVALSVAAIAALWSQFDTHKSELMLAASYAAFMVWSLISWRRKSVYP